MSRFDAIGIFWENPIKEARSSAPTGPRVLPEVPDTGWVIPTEFPRLDAAKSISIDVETKDPGLDAGTGPGFPSGKAFIAGLAIGTDDGRRWYFPVRHAIGENLDPQNVFDWAKKELARPEQPKIGHNILYDLEALSYEGVAVAGKIYDTMLAEPLLDENRFTYNLGACAQTHLGETKVDTLLYDWCSRAFGGPATRSAQAKNIWRAPAALVGPYAQGDVDLPLRVLAAQRKILEAQGLSPLYEMECSLIPVLLGMRRRGVRVDVPGAERLAVTLRQRILEDEKRLRSLAGCEINTNAPESIAKAFTKAGIDFPRTVKGAPSFVKEWLEAHPSEIAQIITQIRKWKKFLGTFIEGYIINSHVNGRVYGQFHQLKSDNSGTISGRFSSSAPNLENIPARDEELGPMVRNLFLPEEGEDWCSDDYSQVEYRIIVHYGDGPSADRARKMYNNDPTTDFHNMVVDMTGLNRKRAKNINFGKSYGMGVKTAAVNMGVTEAEAQFFIDQYDREMPFVGELLQRCSDVVQQRGWLKTILGRRARFELWEQKSYNNKAAELLPYEKAVEKWGRSKTKRAGTYKALNRLIQGSAADIFKKAIADINNAGVYKVLGAPLNLVHDEICSSRPRTKEAVEAHREAVHLMKNVVKLSVPLLVDSEVGPAWGSVK